MITTNTKYIIATKEFPLLFDDGDGNMIDEVEYAYLYDEKEHAQCIIDNTFDKPDNYMVLRVKITLEF